MSDSVEALARATGVLVDEGRTPEWPWQAWVFALAYGVLIGLGFAWAITG
ncbi:hypothetical protein CCICO_04255 [Corynebacterium ciconiae DSM 44920]|nr:hypothetical protein [Corynebacterium ciconiae]WKD60888.1 hypothetical protein CCICO_04255 [Corynebacterium ciconiae DSM 44920]